MFQFTTFPSLCLLSQHTMTEVFSAGFPHSDTHGYYGCLPLTMAFRSLLRPSSALSATSIPPFALTSLSYFSNIYQRRASTCLFLVSPCVFSFLFLLPVFNLLSCSLNLSYHVPKACVKWVLIFYLKFR